MYGWLWRQLPGGTVAKALAMLLIAVVAFAILWLVVFPWVYTTFPVLRVGQAATAAVRLQVDTALCQ